MKKIIALLLTLALIFGLVGCGITEADFEAVYDMMDQYEQGLYVGDDPADTDDPYEGTESSLIDRDGWYYSAEDVSLYLNVYGCLPENFVTKDEARELGWDGGSVEQYALGYAIGGDVFGNREGLLPEAEGRIYYECDIDTDGREGRGAKRLVFSNDGLIYYTEDHYETFTLLYGEE